MSGIQDEWLGGWMEDWRDRRVDGWMSGRQDEWMEDWIDRRWDG